MATLLKRLRQVDWIPSPRFDHRVVISAPAAVHQPKPQVRARFQRKFEQSAPAFGFDRKPAILQVGRVVAAMQSRRDIRHHAHIPSIDQRPVVSITRRPQRRMVRLRNNTRSRRNHQPGSLLNRERRVSAPQKVQRNRTHTLDGKTHLQHLAGQCDRLACPDRADRTQRRKLYRSLRLIARLIPFELFYFPFEGTELSQIGERFSAMDTGISGRIGIIPSTTPVVVEVRIDGITLRTNARVLPKYLPVTRLIPNRQNLGPDAWKNRSRK